MERKRKKDNRLAADSFSSLSLQRLDSTVLRLEGELDDKDENIRDLLRQIAELKDRLDKAEGRLKVA